MTLYIAATPDRYELPCFVADKPAELARTALELDENQLQWEDWTE